MCQLLSCKGKIYGLHFSQRIFLIPLSCVTPSDSITLRVDILPPQNQPVIRIAGFLKLGKQHVKPRMCLMLSRSPSGVESQAELLYAERIICHPLEAAPDSGVRARSLRPAVLPLTGLWLQLCVWRLTQAESQGNSKWNSKILSINQHFQELKLRCLFYNTICENLALCPAKGNIF